MQIDDFHIQPVGAQVYPRLEHVINIETGESHLTVKQFIKLIRKLTMIFKPDGLPFYPHTQFLYALLRQGKPSTSTEAPAPLAYKRFLASKNIT